MVDMVKAKKVRKMRLLNKLENVGFCVAFWGVYLIYLYFIATVAEDTLETVSDVCIVAFSRYILTLITGYNLIALIKELSSSVGFLFTPSGVRNVSSLMRQ